MQPRRAAPILLVILMTIASPGCVVPGLGGSGGKTARAPGTGPDGGAGGPDDISAFSPEVSMQRDLLQLREREAGQRETVENMRLALRQGGEDVAREEERLRDIQMQIERYDSAMRRYEMAGRYAVPANDRRGGDGAPAGRAAAGRRAADSGYSDPNGYNGRDDYAAGPSARFQREDEGGGYAREGNFSQFGGRMGADGMSGGMEGMPGMPEMRGMAGPANANAGEEVLYAGAYDPRLAGQPAPIGDLTLRRAAGRSPARSRPMFEDEAAEAALFAAPDAGAFPPRTAADAWPAPAPARTGAERLAAAPAERTQPVVQRERPALPAAPPAAQARPEPEDDGMDEVFTPDLFLSRR